MTFTGQDPATGLTITVATNLATVPSGEGSALIRRVCVKAEWDVAETWLEENIDPPLPNE